MKKYISEVYLSEIFIGTNKVSFHPGTHGGETGGFKLIKNTTKMYKYNAKRCSLMKDLEQRKNCREMLRQKQIVDMQSLMSECKDDFCIQTIQEKINKLMQAELV